MGGFFSHPKEITDSENEMYKHIKTLRDRRCCVFWVVGATGTGKSEMCKVLARHYRFRHIEISKLLYTIVAHDDWVPDSPDPNKANEIANTNYLVERRLLLSAVLHEMLNHIHSSRGFILDGFPRHVEQGIEFIQRVCPLTFILYFKVSERGLKRLIWQRNDVIHRIEDFTWEEMAKERMRSFKRFVLPILEYFEKYVLEVNVERGWKQLTSDLMDTLDDFLTTRGMVVPARYFDASVNSSDDDTPRKPGPKYIKQDRQNLAKTPHPNKLNKAPDSDILLPITIAPEKDVLRTIYAREIAEQEGHHHQLPRSQANRLIPKSQRKKLRGRNSSSSTSSFNGSARGSPRGSPRVSPRVSPGGSAAMRNLSTRPRMSRSQILSGRSSPLLVPDYGSSSWSSPSLRRKLGGSSKSNFNLKSDNPTILKKNTFFYRKTSLTAEQKAQIRLQAGLEPMGSSTPRPGQSHSPSPSTSWNNSPSQSKSRVPTADVLARRSSTVVGRTGSRHGTPFVRRESREMARRSPVPSQSSDEDTRSPKYSVMFPPARRSSTLKVPGKNPSVVRRLPGAEGSERSFVRRGTGITSINFALGRGPPSGELPKHTATRTENVSQAMKEVAKGNAALVVRNKKVPGKKTSIVPDKKNKKK